MKRLPLLITVLMDWSERLKANKHMQMIRKNKKAGYIMAVSFQVIEPFVHGIIAIG
jgi:hypothetical protein